jgi:hypothetical protein
VGGSIVRLTSLDNAKSSPVRGRTVALHRSQPHDGHGAMSAVEDPGTKLTPAEWRDLRRLAAFMVPASAEYGVPGADDEAIFADIAALNSAAEWAVASEWSGQFKYLAVALGEEPVGTAD